MSQKSGQGEGKPSSVGKELGRRETLQLATLAAALGAGLSVSLHVDEASAAEAKGAEATQLQLKFYRAQQKGEALLLYATVLPVDVSKTLLEGSGIVQVRGYGKEALLGTGEITFKPPAPPVQGGWDPKQNKKI